MLARAARAAAVRVVLRLLAHPATAMNIIPLLLPTIDKRFAVEQVSLPTYPSLMEDTSGIDGGTNQRKYLRRHRCSRSNQQTICL